MRILSRVFKFRSETLPFRAQLPKPENQSLLLEKVWQRKKHSIILLKASGINLQFKQILKTTLKLPSLSPQGNKCHTFKYNNIIILLSPDLIFTDTGIFSALT